MTATPDLSPPYAGGREAGVGRDLVLVGLDAVITFAAVAAAGRYAWLLGNAANNNTDWDFDGWQLTIAKVLIGVVVVAFAVLGALAMKRGVRSLSGRTQYARVVVLGAILPGVFAGLQVQGPINSTLSWASNHTAAARAVSGQLRAPTLNNRNAPFQAASPFPAATAAVARRLLTTSSLGSGWYAMARPATRAARIAPRLANWGAVAGGSTSLVRASRSPTGWNDTQFLVETFTKFRTAGEAREYAASARQSSTAPCNCGSPVPATTVSDVATRRIFGVAVQTWIDQDGTATDRSAAFRSGKTAVTLSVLGNSGHEVPSRDFASTLRRAVKLSGRSAHRAA